MRFTVALLLAVVACHNEPTTQYPGNTPPLPPSSGTPVGYLIDSSADLKLRDDQLKQLQEIDASLAARDAEVDTQLRQIAQKKAEEEQPPPKGSPPQRPKNRAPGADGKPEGDEAKLHQIRDLQDRDALRKAWALLDKDQQTAATKILNDHDVEVPGGPKRQGIDTSEDGQPVPGIEP